ncbi:MAG: hypothetical protein FWC09_03570 [Lachnospiraceae bacterium]|nr:hypothetical protein [Lachnospiraceae bacterium]
MRKVLTIILLTLIMTQVSCNTRGPFPYGVWQSENPNITLYLDDDKNICFGTYLLNGDEISIIANFYYFKRFSIYDANVDMNKIDFYELAYYVGDYKVRGDKLTYNIIPYWSEKTGVKRIIFKKISDVKVIEE